MNIEFGKILSRAWEITWKHKILWLFGFLAMLAGGGGGNRGGDGFYGTGYRFHPSDISEGNVPVPAEIQPIVDWFNQIDWSMVVLYASILIALGLLIWVVFFVLSVIGRGALIGGIRKADSDGSVTLHEAWAIGRKYFWRILGIKVLEFFLILGIIILLAVPTVFLAIATLGCMTCPMILLMIIVVMLLSLYTYFVQLAIVSEDLEIGAALSRAAQILRDHIGPIILFGLIIFIVGIGVAIVGFALFLPAIGFLLAGSWPVMLETGTFNMGLIYTGAILALVLLPVMWLISAVMETWTTAVYTLAYKQFTRPSSLPAEAD